MELPSLLKIDVVTGHVHVDGPERAPPEVPEILTACDQTGEHQMPVSPDYAPLTYRPVIARMTLL